MLRRFESIKNCGIFEDFRWNSSVPDFERINLIYGQNGAGKTCLSRALDSLNGERGGFANVSITTSKPDGAGAQTSRQAHIDEFDRVFVFSEWYVERSHNFNGDAEVEAVLTLGEQTVEDEKRIAELHELIEQSDKEVAEAIKSASDSATALDGEYESIARGVVAALSRAGGEYRSNSNYNKGVARRRFDGSHDDWTSLDDQDWDADIATVTSDNREAVAIRSYSLTVRPELKQEAETLLDESPVSVVLDTLKEHEEAASWVEEGRGLHKDSPTCIFCGGNLDDGRKQQIEQHFSDEVQNVQDGLDTLIRETKGAQSSLASLLGDGAIAGSLFDDLRAMFTTSFDSAKEQAEELTSWLAELLEVLERKRGNVVAQVEHSLTDPPAVDGAAIEDTLKAHNKRVANHAGLVQEAAKRIELHLLKEAETRVKKLGEDAKAKANKKVEVGEALRKYREEVTALENVEGDPLPSAEVISRELTRILGRSELAFELLPDGKHYRVTRHGSVARDLSAGERTAISLIHFLQHVKNADVKGGKPIAVIDDPVSSLDSGSAMGISTYIWSETVSKEHIEQVFLLTHNFELFRQWDIQIDGLPNRRGKDNKKGYTSSCYELFAPHQSVAGISKRVPAFIVWPPNDATRRKVRSSYHHLFITAARARAALLVDSTMEKRLDAMLLFPNVLRRMLETFIAFKSPTSVGSFTTAMRELGTQLEALGYEGDADALRLHLTRFTHASSHADSPETDVVVNPEEIETIIAAVFTFMNVLDKEHFEGLCTVVGVDPTDLLLQAQEVTEAGSAAETTGASHVDNSSEGETRHA